MREENMLTDKAMEDRLKRIFSQYNSPHNLKPGQLVIVMPSMLFPAEGRPVIGVILMVRESQGYNDLNTIRVAYFPPGADMICLHWLEPWCVEPWIGVRDMSETRM